MAVEDQQKQLAVRVSRTERSDGKFG